MHIQCILGQKTRIWIFKAQIHVQDALYYHNFYVDISQQESTVHNSVIPQYSVVYAQYRWCC